MAGFEMYFPEDFMSDLLDSDFEEIAKNILEECSAPLEESVKSSLQRSAEKGYATGTMVASVKATKPKKAKNDAVMLHVRPTGRDKNGVRNMEKAIYLEYGTEHESARPWLVNATKNVESTCLDKMQQAFNKEVGAR